jgi:hypothetical protein
MRRNAKTTSGAVSLWGTLRRLFAYSSSLQKACNASTGTRKSSSPHFNHCFWSTSLMRSDAH